MTQSNVPTFEEMLQIVNDLGTSHAEGKDTQVKYDLKVASWASTGAIDLLPNKHGHGISDAVKLAMGYVRAHNSRVIFDLKAPNEKRVTSNTKKLIKVMRQDKWGNDQPLGTMNDLVTARQNLKKAGHPVIDAHNAIMKWATAQLKTDKLIKGDELKEFALKQDPEPSTAEDVLDAVRKTVMKLRAGAVPNCPDMDDSQETKDIIGLIGKRLTDIAKARSTI